VEAINHLTKGLEVLMTLPDTLERAQKELDVQITLGPMLIAIKGISSQDTERAYARARELCQQVGETSQLFPVLSGLFSFHTGRAEFQTARELAEQLFSLAEREQDPGLLQDAHRMLGMTMFQLGEPAPARAHFEQGMANAAWQMWFLGYPDQALDRVNEAVNLAQERTHPFSMTFAFMLNTAALVHQSRREAQAAQERAEALIALSTEQSFPHWLPYGTILRGWALTAQGKGAEGIAQMRQGLAAYQVTRSKLNRPYLLSLLAEAYGKVGQPEEGLTVLVEALALVDSTGERYWEAELHRRKGELLLMQQGQKVGEAEECFRQALDIARRQQAKSLELRAAMSLSRLWERQRKQEEAHHLLAEIYGWFTEGFDTADLKEAKVLLEELA
jgi:predicted ATPase